MTASPNRQYFPAIDQLRGFAATLVLFYHGSELIGARLAHNADFSGAQDWIFSLNPLVAFLQEGHSGVAMFIVLSGFILSLGAIGRDIDYPRFIAARVLRIYPLLIVCLAAAVLSSDLSGITLRQVVVTLLPFNVAGNLVNNFTIMFWAVALEFQCYLLFPLMIALSNRFGVKALIFVTLATLTTRLGIFYLHSGESARELSYASIFGRFDQFLVGMIAARLLREGKLGWMGGRVLAGAVLLLFAALTLYNQAGGGPADSNWKLYWPTLEAAIWALFIVSYFQVAGSWKGALSFGAAKLGEISYSTYLWHFAIIQSVISRGWFLHMTGLPYEDSLLTTFLVVLPITLVAGFFSYHIIEKPFLSMRPKYLGTVQVQPAT